MKTAAFPSWLARIVGVLLTLCVLASPAFAEGGCPASPTSLPIALPHLRSAVTRGVEGIIVALGSSSTQGVAASDLAHSYPAVLQEVLSDGLPAAHIAVINRGIGGQDAPEELARLEKDVVAVRPQVVIWQVGANGALRGTDPGLFRSLVSEGVRHLQAAGIDVILMDNQQSPRLLAHADEVALDMELAQVAADTGAALFSRRALMRAWRNEGLAYADFIATDGLHHNDRGYLCVAQALGRSILTGLKQSSPQPQTASR